MRRFALLLPFVCLAVSATAATRTWTGASSALWSDGGNWSLAGPPVAGDALVFPSGASHLTMTNDLPAGFSVGAVTFSGDGYVLNGNALTLLGNFMAQGHTGQCNVALALGADLRLNAGGVALNGALDVHGYTLWLDAFVTTLGAPINGSGSILVGSGNAATISGSGNYSGNLSGSFTFLGGSLPNATFSWVDPDFSIEWVELNGNGTIGNITVPGNSNVPSRLRPGQDCCGYVLAGGVLHTKALNIAGKYHVDLYPGAQTDQVQVTGSVTLSGQLFVAIPSTPVTPGQSFTIIDNDGSDPVIGAFASLPEGATVSVGGATLAISYHGGDGNDVVLTAAGVTKRWTGANSGLWSDPGNWSPAAIPVAGEALIFPAGASNKTMTNDLAAGFNVGAITVNDDSYVFNGNGLTLLDKFGAGSHPGQCNVALTLGTNLHIEAGGMAMNGAIDVHDYALTLDAFVTTLNGPINGSGSITTTSGFALIVTGSGNFTGNVSSVVTLLGGSLPNATLTLTTPDWLALNGYGTFGNVSIPGSTSVPSRLLPGQDCCGYVLAGGVLHTKSLNLAGMYNVDLFPGAQSDMVQVTGSVTLGGQLFVALPGNPATPGQSFTIIDNDGSDAVTGTFAGLPEGASVSASGATLTISYHGGDGNDVVLTVAGAVKRWTGANSGLWSDPGNWTPAAIPVAGEPLIFPAGASHETMTNDLPAGFSVGSMTFGDDPYVINGNALTLLGKFTAHTGQCNVALTLGANLHIEAGMALNGALDVNGHALTLDAFVTTVNGPINGSGSITSTSGFSLAVTGSGTFTGNVSSVVTLLGGSLPNATLSLTASEWVSLNGYGTFGNVTIPGSTNIPSRLFPGQDCCGYVLAGGVLHTKSLNLAGKYNVDLFPGAQSDQVQVTGSVTLSGQMFLSLPSSVPALGQQFTIVDNDGTDAVIGTFAALPEGAVLSAGGSTFVVSYHGGDGNDVVLTTVAHTTASLTQSSPSSTFGESVTFTAAIDSDIGPASGSVSFVDGGVLLGTAPLQGGSAAFTTAALSGGAHSVTAVFAGGNNFAPSTSAPLSHQVQKGAATLALNASKLSLTFGDPLTLTASLIPVAPSSAAATGSVTFNADGSALAPAAIVNGQAAFLTSTLAAGTHALTASYTGDTNYNGASTAAPLSVTVAKAATTLDVHSLHNPSRGDESVVLQVTVGVVNPQTPISGMITVSENGQPLAQQAVTGNSSSTSVNGLASGVHHLTVTFTGDNFEPSSQALVQTVLPSAISLADASVVEGNSGTKVVSIAVHLSVRSSQPVSVQYRSQDGSAKAGEDYLAVDGTLTFAPGETGKNIAVTIVGDTTTEHDESFHVLLSNATNATLEGGPATVTIVNDDPWFKTTTFTYAPQRTLDVDTPIFGNGPFPAIVWVGGATSYAPGGDSPALRETERGYVVVIPTYRTPDQARFPAQLDDLKAAIAWIRANASTLNVDPLHIGVWGGGAGAHLASLAGVTGSGVQAVVDWGGPSDLLKLQSDATASCVGSYDDASSAPSQLIGCALQTCPASANAASPLSSVTSDDAPILIIHGAADCVVPAEQSRRFFAALQAVHVDATLHVIDNLGAFGPSWDAAVSHGEVDAFLDAHLKNTTSKRRGVSH